MKTIFRLTPLYIGGLLAAALIAISSPGGEANALSLSNPAAAGPAKFASEGLTTEVRGHGGGHGGGHFGGHHFGGGGRHFGGFRGSFHRGGFGGYRRHGFYGGPVYYGYAPRRCRIVWTYYGPRRICRFHHRRFHHRRFFY
jgi:hypothetical protein